MGENLFHRCIILKLVEQILNRMIWILLLIFVVMLFIFCLFCHERVVFLTESFQTKNKINMEQVQMGSEYYKDKKIVLCGLMRDCESNIPHMKAYINELSKVFAHVHCLIVENDSSDNTRMKLLEWVAESSKYTIEILGCGVNAPFCKLDVEIPSGNDLIKQIGSKRIGRMVHLRNIYLDHIRNSSKLSNYDFTCVLDMDLRIQNFNWKLIAHTGSVFYSHSECEAVAGNGWLKLLGNVYYYYDGYAYSAKTGLITYSHLLNLFVPNQVLQDSWRISSAFGGIIIYKTAALLSQKYTLQKDLIGYRCEHMSVNENLDVRFDSQCLLLIQDNPPKVNH